MVEVSRFGPVIDWGRQLLRRAVSPGTHDPLHSDFAQAAVGTLSLRLMAMGVSLLTSLLFARCLGVSGYGTYTYALTWAGLLTVPATLGLDRLLVRNMAVYRARSAWGLMHGLWRWANQLMLLTASGLAVLAAAGSWAFASHFDTQALATFRIALLLVPLTVMLRLSHTILRGLHHIVAGQLPEMVIQPFLLLALGGSAFLLSRTGLSAPLAVGLNVVATSIACGVGMRQLQKILPSAVHEATPEYDSRVWLRSALPLLFAAAMSLLMTRIDVVMLGAVRGVEAVGLYSVASRGAECVAFLLGVTNMTLGPTIARLYAQGERERLQQIVTLNARVTFALSLLPAIGLIAYGPWFLGLFGPDFSQAHVALTLLSVGQLVNVAMGSVGQLLMMTGHEDEVAKGMGISAALNVGLNVLLIPHWGLAGAAAATATSTIVWNVLLAIWVYKKLGIHATALGRIGRQARMVPRS